MFAAAWDEPAVQLLERAAARAGVACERAGPLAVIGAPGAAEAGWRCWLSGRLTNAAELRRRLGLAPVAGDAALVARAYARFGFDACKLLRGTFLVVAFDRKRRIATVARDHLGGRPLVHTRVRAGALFAEHERTIVELLPSTPGPERLALAQWIERGTTPAELTLFEGIGRVPPAHRAVLSAGSCSFEPYWRPRYEGIAPGSRQEVAERLRAAAFAAVQRAAEGAARPAVLLSGGLDSSCVAAGLAARPRPTPEALALSGVFPTHPETDERELIEATARHTGLPFETIAFDERASILVPALEHIDRWSLPPATPNQFAWLPLMARARELGIDAMLDGEGGDELFGFAPRLIADMLRAGRALGAWRLTARIPEIGACADARLRLRALRMYGAGPLLPPAVRRRRRRTRAARRAASASSLLHASDLVALVELEESAGARRLDGPLWWRSLAESLSHPGETMGVAAHLRREAADERIDRRHPFLFDLDLLTCTLASPPAMQFEIRDRALLRDGLAGHIPEAVRTRHEKSFFTNLLPAGLTADGALLAEGPARRDAPVRAFVRPQALDALLRAGPSPSEGPAARRLWHVGLADAWLRSLQSPQYARQLLDRTHTFSRLVPDVRASI